MTRTMKLLLVPVVTATVMVMASSGALRIVPPAVTLAAARAPLPALPAPTSNNPMGPLVNVTAHWRSYQPASTFCIRPDAFQVPAGTDATATGRNAACRASGYPAKATGLYLVSVPTPPLCSGCVRLFIDFGAIPQLSSTAPKLVSSAHGHVFFKLASMNPGYTVSPTAHSPNIKNLTNDALVAPPGTVIPTLTGALDAHLITYVGDTRRFSHDAVQGPYYTGPWYVNTAGKRIYGAYLDVRLSGATQLPARTLNDISYLVGFNSGTATCPDNVLFNGKYADGNYFYAGCADRFGMSDRVDPWMR